MKAYVTLAQDGFLATLDDGQRIYKAKIQELAQALHEAGLDADDVNCADWREGFDVAPGAGQAIALKTELRRLRL